MYLADSSIPCRMKNYFYGIDTFILSALILFIRHCILKENGTEEINVMVDISELFANIAAPEPATKFGWDSQLEGIIGGYWTVGLVDTDLHPDLNLWVDIYYDESFDSLYSIDIDIVKLENKIAFLSPKYKLVLVREDCAAKIKTDLKGYGFSYVCFPSLTDEVCCCTNSAILPEAFQDIMWIADDFLFDENIEFDFAAFAKIDDGVRYLNPVHFSVEQLINFIHESIWFANR